MKIKNLVLACLVAVAGLVLASKAQAAEFSGQSLTLGDSRPNVSSSYAFVFTHTSAATIRKFTFDFCKVPSGAGTTCGSPVTTGDVSAATRGTLDADLGTATNWGVTVSSKVITLYNNTAPIAIPALTGLAVQFTGLVNTTLEEACDAAATDTCYVWVKSYDDTNTIIDTGVVTYTIIEQVTVTAKVDPTFTFVVSGVGNNTVTNGITTSVTSTSTTLPFGSLQPGTPKYAAHALRVTTNTVSGYTITATLVTPMTGIVGSNNIDPYPAPWSAPTLWTQPTGGGPNVDTGWFAGNTNDADVTNWTTETAGKFGGISSTAVNVGEKNSSDNGVTPMLVTYAVGVNVFQPSDFYTGTLVYNALPRY
jgi:hypothetical protein